MGILALTKFSQLSFVFRIMSGGPRKCLCNCKLLPIASPGSSLPGSWSTFSHATQLQVPRAHVIAAMRDSAFVNGCALRAVKELYPKMFEVTCFSHTIGLVGSRFEVPTPDQFIQWWIQLFSRSAAAKLRWKERTGVAINLSHIL